MKRQPGEASARGNSVWRWLLCCCCCCVASASASASAASASAPVEGRRSASATPHMYFLPGQISYVLTPRHHFAGTQNKKFGQKGRSTKLDPKVRMPSQWKYGVSKLKGQAALELLKADRSVLLVRVKDYCLGMPVLDKFIVPGALPQVDNNGNPVLEEKSMLSQTAQEVIRAILLLLEDLFKAGFFLDEIDDSTMLIDVATATVLLSKEALDHQVTKIGTELHVVDTTIASIALKLNEWLFVQNNYSLAEVPEVGEGLFKLMANNGDSNWYAIVNNMALVPVENRREVFIRLYEHLITVVRKNSMSDYLNILQDLDFPMNWHDAVAPEKNGILFKLYSLGTYNATAPTKKDQAEQITRLFRNTGAHALDKLSHRIGHADVTRVHYALAPLLAVSLQAALQKRKWLVATTIHTLIVYSRQSYT